MRVWAGMARKKRGKIVTKAATKKAGKGKKKAECGEDAKQLVSIQSLREQIIQLVGQKMGEMTKAISDEAAKGHLAQFKYLLEVIGLHPSEMSTQEEPEDGNDLAKTLLTKFEFPHSLPVNEEDEEKVPVAAGSDSVE
jgi:hypothetical protein